MPGKPLHKRLLGPPYRLGLRVLSRLHPRRVRDLLLWGVGVLAAIRRRRRDPRLTVAVDVSPLWEPLTGIGWYLYRLLQHLAPRQDLVLRLYGPTLAAAEAVPPPVVPLPEGPALERVLYAIPEDASLHRDRLIHLVRRLEPWLVAADGNRVVFAPNYLPSPRFAAAPGALVATVHDLGYRRVPWAVRRETQERLEAELDQVWFRARRIVTDSRAVRDEIVAEGLAASGRLRVVPLGPGQLPGSAGAEGASPPPAGLPPGGYALSVGTLEPRKNLETLLEAWRALRRRRSGAAPPLVLCGAFGWKAEGLRTRVEAARAEGWLHHLGYVDEAALAALYRGARLFVFPSRYEGFGLPVLEALAAGVPVVASDLPVVRELAAGAALYAPPMDVEAWVRQVERLLDDPELARRLAEAGGERARRYTWGAAAEAYAEIFREAAGAGG
ncbi:MAG TPA: glycosyltransferase family 1 protein [Thermoanaerobaculia bacterium]